MNTILEILLVNTKTGVSKKTQQPYSISEAHCVIRNVDGTPGAVGVLVVPKALEVVAKVGLFTAEFTLGSGTYGDQQGRIQAQLAGLTPTTQSAARSLLKL